MASAGLVLHTAAGADTNTSTASIHASAARQWLGKAGAHVRVVTLVDDKRMSGHAARAVLHCIND